MPEDNNEYIRNAREKFGLTDPDLDGLSPIQRYARYLEKENERLKEMALTDELTGLPNERFFRPPFKKAIEQLGKGRRRLKKIISCAVFDVKNFKNGINEKYGRSTGDLVLKAVAKTLAECTRQLDSDLAARFGGGADEFKILFTEEGEDEIELYKTLYGVILGLPLRIGKIPVEIVYENEPQTLDIGLYMGATVPNRLWVTKKLSQYGVGDVVQNIYDNLDEAVLRIKRYSREHPEEENVICLWIPNPDDEELISDIRVGQYAPKIIGRRKEEFSLYRLEML